MKSNKTRKYAISVDFYKLTPQGASKMMPASPIPRKEEILAYMKRFPFSAYTSQPVYDFFTGEETAPADNQRTDGVYIWYESWIYHFEKYNLKLNDDFVQYVLSQIDRGGEDNA